MEAYCGKDRALTVGPEMLAISIISSASNKMLLSNLKTGSW